MDKLDQAVLRFAQTIRNNGYDLYIAPDMIMQFNWNDPPTELTSRPFNLLEHPGNFAMFNIVRAFLRDFAGRILIDAANNQDFHSYLDGLAPQENKSEDKLIADR